MLAGEQTMGGGFTPPWVPPPTPPPRLLPLRHKQGGCRGADGGDREMSRTAVVLFLSAGINARRGAGVTGGESAEPLGGD